MIALASDRLRHFLLLLGNRWTEFNETWLEARSQRPLPSLYFSCRSEKQDGLPGLWLAETFSTSPLKPLNAIRWNLTGSKISMSSTKFVFSGPICKQKSPPWRIPQKGSTLYSGARYVALWASCLCSDLDLEGWPTLWKIRPGLWLLNQKGYLLLLFTYGCSRRAMLSFWQLWISISARRMCMNISI